MKRIISLAVVSFCLAMAALWLQGPRSAGEDKPADKVPQATAKPTSQSAWAPRLYGFCMEFSDARHRSLPEQAKMLKELGFDGVGYPLWLDESLGSNLRTLDDAGLNVDLLYMSVDLAGKEPLYDPRVAEAFGKLKGRTVTISVVLRGFPPGDPRGLEPAVNALRQLGDLAAQSDLRISIYPHAGDWAESLLHALDVVKKTDHPRVGANFNLCHWLMVDGQKDYQPVLRENAGKIFAVTINGAKIGSKTWAHGLILPLDEGDFDNRRLLATLREIGYGGPIGLMCYGIPGDAREHMERSMSVWRQWQAEWRR